jgi:DNA polymerase-3 subunit gamma/tau
MSYLVLARKWRPMSFSDLVGQEHVSRTLASAIASGRIAHAFLFTGVRGVGKTTSARILAKALNCLGNAEEGKEPGPTIEPCLTCAACREIASGTDMDVREIDGASYNGVDEVRKLQDSLPYRPTRDRYKIIIVDEVHMLSSAAWNAFLKTLEEPPPHVKFVFATTEVHKVPVTILSRVQRFDFKLIPARTIAERLRYVLTQEGVGFDEAAVSILAQKAAGSMRDGMSLLDQVIAFGGDTLRGDDVAQVLGVASRRALLELTAALVQGDAPACLSVVQEVAEQGLDLVQLARDLLGLLRHLVVARIAKNPAQLIDLPDEERREVEELARSAPEADLMRLHHGFSKGFDEVSRGVDPRANLEMLLARLALRPPLLPIDELLHRLGALEKRLSSGRGGSTGVPPTTAPALPPSKPRLAAPRAPRDVPSKGDARPGGDAGDEDPHPAPAAKSSEPPPPRISEPKVRQAEPMAPKPEPTAPKAEPMAPKPEPTAPKAEPTALRPIPPDILERTVGLLPSCDRLRADDGQLASYLEQTEVLSVGPSLVRLGIDETFLFERELTSPAMTAKIQSHLAPDFGPQATVEFVRASVTCSIHNVRAWLRERERQGQIEELRNHPRVKQAVDVLGARIRQVVLPD